MQGGQSPARQGEGEGHGRSGGNRAGGAQEKPCGTRHRVRGARRHLLGVLGNLRPAHDERARGAGGVDHLRAPAAGSPHLPRGVPLQELAQPARRAARQALAAPYRGLLDVRRAAHPDELPVGHLLHECGHGHRAGTPGPRGHHVHRVRARAALAEAARAVRPRVRPGRHVPHRHEGQHRRARHTGRGAHVGRRVGIRAGGLHAASRQGAGEVGQLHRTRWPPCSCSRGASPWTSRPSSWASWVPW